MSSAALGDVFGTSLLPSAEDKASKQRLCLACGKSSALSVSKWEAMHSVSRRLCSCDGPDKPSCPCQCGRPAITHVVALEPLRLVPWCGRGRRCRRVAALSYRWPAPEQRDARRATNAAAGELPVSVGACTGCGQQPNADGPWTDMARELNVLRGDYSHVWVDHWCASGLADIPKLRAVYSNADKVCLPLKGERKIPTWRLALAAFLAGLFIAMAGVVSGGLGPMRFVQRQQMRFVLFVQRQAQRAHSPTLAALAQLNKLLVVTLWTLVAALVSLPILASVSLAHAALAACGMVGFRCARRKRFWLKMESKYARTHAVLCSSGPDALPRLDRSLGWRLAIECAAGEWFRWIPFTVSLQNSRLSYDASTEAFSVGDKLLAAVVGGLDVRGFLRFAARAGREQDRDPDLPGWLPKALKRQYRPSLMGTVIHVKDLPWALHIAVDNVQYIVLRAPSRFWLNSPFVVVRLRCADPDAKTYVVDSWGKELAKLDLFPDRVVVCCRHLIDIKLA